MHHRSSRSRGSSTKEKIRRDNVGKVPLPAEVTATCKDSLPRKIHRQWERLGLAHEPVSDERRATPSDVAWNAMALKVTPWVCKGALGTWQFQEYPDTERPVNNGRTAEANQYEQGCL